MSKIKGSSAAVVDVSSIEGSETISCREVLAASAIGSAGGWPNFSCVVLAVTWLNYEETLDGLMAVVGLVN